MLTVERLDDGEVSPYLTDELRAGDELELRGPIGGYFVWEDARRRPAAAVAGGSGVVPFRAMLRHHAAGGERRPGSAALLVAHARRRDLPRRADAPGGARRGRRRASTLTREQPDGWDGLRAAASTAPCSSEVAWPPSDAPLVYVCGPTGFVEAVADDPRRARTRAGADQDRAVRAERDHDGARRQRDRRRAVRRLRARDDDRRRHVRRLRRDRAGGRGRGLPARPGNRRPLPGLRQRA